MNHDEHSTSEHSCHSQAPKSGHDGHTGTASCHTGMTGDFQKRFWISLILTIPVLALSPMIRAWLGVEVLQFAGDRLVLFFLASAVFFYGGWPFLRGLVTELRDKAPGMMTLIAVAIITAYVYSSAVVFGLSGKIFFWELVTLIDIMLLGHWIEMKSVMGAGRALEELAKLVPSQAHRLKVDGSIEDVPVASLQTGDRVLVKPGEKVPADGVIRDGQSSLNESMLTGESKPVAKASGDAVIGGSINAEGSLTIEIGKVGDESFLAQVMTLVREAQASKSRTQALASRAALWLTIIALGVGGLTLFVWLVGSGQDVAFALERTVTVMIITCPHALGLAVPLVVSVSTALSARHGFLIRNRIAFEQARRINAVLLDKTGTLTKGEFGITDTIVFVEQFNADTVTALAAAVEAHSEHPIARSIAAAVPDRQTITEFRAIPGKGAEARVGDAFVQVVSPGYVAEKKISYERSQIEPLSQQGKTVVFVLVNDKLAGAIALADVVRPESKAAISRLKDMGIRSIMITGDHRDVAATVAEELGVDEFFAEVLPQDKVAKVRSVQERGLVVAMVGDGVNDAPALAQADVGIAIGAGTDVAVATADIILVKSNPSDIVAVIQLARSTYAKMVQNLWWATGYNVIMIPLAAGVLYPFGIVVGPAVGALLMSLSTVIVAINARLLRVRG